MSHEEIQKTLEPAIAREGVKDDRGKPRFDLISPDVLFGLAEVLTMGSGKYAARNWEKGMSWGRVFGAAMRHAWKFWRGERTDADDGQHHLASAICNLMMLMHYDLHPTLYAQHDDRIEPVRELANQSRTNDDVRAV